VFFNILFLLFFPIDLKWPFSPCLFYFPFRLEFPQAWHPLIHNLFVFFTSFFFFLLAFRGRLFFSIYHFFSPRFLVFTFLLNLVVLGQGYVSFPALIFSALFYPSGLAFVIPSLTLTVFAAAS